MKKLLGIVVLSLLLSGNAYAKENILLFNQYLKNNGYNEYIEEVEICKELKKNSKKWFDAKCESYPKGRKILRNKKHKIKFYNSSEIPEKANPNDDTLTYYLWVYLNRNWNSHLKYSLIKASENPYNFKYELKEDKYIKNQMQKTALLSYLLYEDGKIVIDEIVPKEKYLGMFNNDTKYHSQSVGKSISTYILAHAVCKGYIENVNSRLNDWPLLENTLYYNQKILDLLNMSAGDKNYVQHNYYVNSNRKILDQKKIRATYLTIKMAMKNELKNSIKSKKEYNYNNLLPPLILNYIIYKIGDEKFEELLNEIFTNKIRIENSSFFATQEAASYNDKSISNTLLASRYDYLRIAKAILDDWQNDTCEGKFLKNIYNNKVKKTPYRIKDLKNHISLSKAHEYAGFFHLYTGLNDRKVMGMDGYGGQSILIDFDKGRIVSTMSIHLNYNWKKIVYDPIKKGK
jgi:hypothetical protein